MTHITKNFCNILNINKLPPPIDGGKENDFTYSKYLSELLWRFVRIAVHDPDDVTMSDVELLDSVLRYGSIKTVCEKTGMCPTKASYHLKRIFSKLEQRVTQWEAAQSLTREENRIADLERQLEKARQRRAELEAQLDAETTLLRRTTVSAARKKSMAIETRLRERKHTQ